MNLHEITELVEYTINNNRVLQAKGIHPITISLEGHSGLGKTSILLQIAERLGMQVRKVNLHQIEETGDLIGYPCREIKMVNDTDEVWVDDKIIKHYQLQGYKPTTQSRMSYSIPEWVPTEENGILILDDFNRAEIRILQAAMEIVDRQEYVSWKLPKGWTIILTNNPDDGDYIVTSTDVAHKTRYTKFDVDFDVKLWASWAELAEIDGRLINFLLLNQELVTKEVNPRAITNFFHSLKSIDDYTKVNNLALIHKIGNNSLGTVFTNMLTQFIHNKLDKLIQPEEMLRLSEEHVLKTISGLVGDPKTSAYRADIASLLVTRLINYTFRILTKKEVWDPKYVDRIIAILTMPTLQEDIKMYAVKKLIAFDHIKFMKLQTNPKLVQYVIG